MKKIVIIVMLVFAFAALGCEQADRDDLKVLYHANFQGHAGSGYPPVDNKMYATGDTAVVLYPGTLIKPGYKFDHWNTRYNNPELGTNYMPGDTIVMKYTNVDLYAIWILQ
jgi:hypothetical protein